MTSFLILGGDSPLAQCFSFLFPEESIRVSKKECDITKERDLEKTIKKYKCKYVLNCAAITDIEHCEKEPLASWAVNTVGVYFLNKSCLKYKKKLIHISSDYALFPTNIYGWSKYVSERIVHPKNLVIRTSFYSLNTYLVRRILQTKQVTAYKNVYFNPISINRLAREIYKNKNRSGIFNAFTSSKLSKFDFAKRVCKVFNLDKGRLVIGTRFKNKEGFAFRPLNSFVRSDLRVDIEKDLIEFRKFIGR